MNDIANASVLERTSTRFENQVALITGSATGLGYAMAERLTQEGAIVVVADVNRDAGIMAAETLKKTNPKSIFQYLDVQSADSAKEAVDVTMQKFGRLDIHVNNAGIVDRSSFLDCTVESWNRVMAVNLTGTFVCGQAAARAMVPAGRGRIINLASVSGQFGGTGRSAYGASKGAIITLTKTMAVELAEYGITVNAISPGTTQVARTAHGPAQRAAFLSRMAIKRYGAPSEMAAAVAFLASQDAEFITGHVLNVDGGFAAAGVLFDASKGL